MLIYDVHVCAVELQQVCFDRQLLWYVCDVVANTHDDTIVVAQAAAWADHEAGEVWQCEDNDYQAQGVCAGGKKDPFRHMIKSEITLLL